MKRSDDEEDEDGLQTSMHGRLMVSTHGFKKDEDVENGESQPVQYRLQAVKVSASLSYGSHLFGLLQSCLICVRLEAGINQFQNTSFTGHVGWAA